MREMIKDTMLGIADFLLTKALEKEDDVIEEQFNEIKAKTKKCRICGKRIHTLKRMVVTAYYLRDLESGTNGAKEINISKVN